MKKRILLSMLAMILAFAQVWAAPVDSLQINPRTTSLPDHWNGVELTECNSDLFVTGIKPVNDINIVEVTGNITSSDSWSSIPNPLTFKTKVGKPVTYTFTLSYCYYYHNLCLFPDDPPKARLKDESGMFSIDETCTYVTQHEAKIIDTDGFSHSYTCMHYIRKVTVTYTPTERGTHSAKLKIQHAVCAFGTIINGFKTIELVGTAIDPSISVSPSSLTFSDATVGETYTKSLVVFGHDLSWADNLMVSSSNSNFTVSPGTITASDAEAGKIVTVTYKPTATGTHTGTITIYGGGAEKKTVSVKGTCTTPATPTINTSVTAFTFGTVIKGYTATRTFTVTGSNLTGSLAVSSNNSNFTVSPATLPASGGTVTVTYKPTAVGSHSATITISGGGAASNTVTATGICVVPNITTTVSSLAFGTVVKGEQKSLTFKVTGTHLTGSLTLSSSNSNFTVSPTTITAANAANGVIVTVTYKPTATGSHSGTITISGGGAADKVVSVSGKCVIPKITTSVSSLAFGTVVKDKQKSLTFKVTGTDLTGSLTVSSSNSTLFTVTPTSITAAEAKAGKTVTVTYKPTAAGSHSATITVKGGGASPMTVSVTGKCVVPTITVSETSLLFAGYNDSRTFKVTGTNLTGSLTVSSNSSYFAVSPTTISVTEAKAGKTVLVHCVAATNVQHATGTITISGGGASSKIVRVSLDATGNMPYAPLVLPDDEADDERYGRELQTTQDVLGNSAADVGELAGDVKIYAEGQDIVIETPVEQSAIVSDIAGHARRVNLQAGRNVIPAGGNGVHIVRVGEKSAKLMLR